MKRVLAFVAAFLALITAGCGAQTSPAGSYGFDSPEGAARAYLEGLRDVDFQAMASAFAGDSKEAIFDSILRQYLALYAFESGQYVSQDPPKTSSEKAASDFIAQYGSKAGAPRLSELSVLGFIPLEGFSDYSPVLGGLDIIDTYFGEEAQSLFARRAKEHGFDSAKGCVAVFEIGVEVYLLCLDAYEKDGKWLIGQLGGDLASFMYLSSGWMGLAPLSAAGYDAGVDVGALRGLLAQ